MKKTLIGGAALLLAASVASADISLASTFGGNEDNIWGEDFMSWSRKKDDPATTDRDEGDEFESSVANISDRLQLDYSSEKIDGRIRLEFSNSTHNAGAVKDDTGATTGVKNSYTINLGGKNGSLRLRGFARFTPIEQIQFAAGNDFFTKYGVSAAYLAAADDTYSSGKMAESGLAFTAKFNTFKFVANWAGDSQVDNLDKLGLNFGADFVVPDTVKLGATLKNATSDDRTFGIFAGLGSVENLILNVGYIYNDNDVFAAKHAVQGSVGYNFKDAGINLAADVVSALTNEYVKDGDTEEYKNSDGDKIYPFYTRVAAAYSATENLTVKGDVKLSTVFGEDNSTTTVVYPSVEYKLPKKMGSVQAGVRFTFQDLEDNGGLQKFSIPLCWKWTPVSVKSEK
mgnify:CR=1 FL=1